ncbi:MAG: Ig-like domain-containing protein [Anaerolineales bacterium]|nr:Ig-like domain-containing protein [Anaerolineales bacterium]
MKRDSIFGPPARPIFTLLVIFSLLAGCNLPAASGGVSVWIDVPLDGLAFPDVRAIKISGHAASPGGVSRVEILINGALLTTINNPPMEGALASFHTEWTPGAPGEYTIQVLAFGADGTASSPDSARVTFGEAPATPVESVTPVVTDTPTPVVTDTPTLPPPPAATVIQFWAEPSTITAGACTTIRWHVENASRVVFGGVDQALDGSYSDCLCENTRYTLRVTRPDGVEETRTVDIAVTGSCVTPTVPPPSDTTPPPAPSLQVPANGLSIACKGSQTLAWLPVSDPSGIANYQVQVQRHSGDNNWQAAPGGSITVVGKTTSVPVECGWIYRWRARAVDGAGNIGSWSGWWLFTITLG